MEINIITNIFNNYSFANSSIKRFTSSLCATICPVNLGRISPLLSHVVSGSCPPSLIATFTSAGVILYFSIVEANGGFPVFFTFISARFLLKFILFSRPVSVFTSKYFRILSAVILSLYIVLCEIIFKPLFIVC